MKPSAIIAICLGLPLSAGVSTAGDLDFYRDIYPFLKANCISCHNKTTTKAGLNMETPELMRRGGDSGPSIVPGKSGDSLLVEASVHSDYIEMPPDNNKTGARDLTPAELARLRQWIDEGAKSSKQEIRQVVWQALASEVDPIYAVAMTKDGRYAACGRGSEIFLYDLAEQRLAARIGEGKTHTAHRALVNSLAFNSGGNRLASGSFREVKIWKESRTPASIREADAALGLRSATPSPDGKQIIAVDKGGALLVLDAVSGKVLCKFEKSVPGDVQLLAVSPDGAKAAAFSSGWHLGVWSLASGKPIAAQTTPDPSLETKAKAARDRNSAAARAFVAAENAFRKSTAAKALAADALKKLKAKHGGDPTGAGKPQIAAAQAALAAATRAESAANTATDKARKAADAANQAAETAAQQTAQSREATVRALAWSSDGKSVLTAGDDKLVRVWTIPAAGGAGFSAPKILAGAGAAVTCVVAGGPDNRIAAGSADGKVRIWNLSDGKIVREISVAANHIAFSPDGKRLASGGADGRVLLWDATTGEQLFDLRGSPEISRKIAGLEQNIDREKLEQAFQNAQVTTIETRDKDLADLLKKAKDAVVAMNKKLPEAEKAIPPAKEARVAAEKKVTEAEAALKSPPEGKSTAALESELKKAKVALLAAETKENDAAAALEAFKKNIIDAQAEQKKITDSQAENKKQIAEAKAAAEAAKKKEAEAATALAAAKKEAATIGAKPLALAFSADGARVASGFDGGSIRVWAAATGIPLEMEKSAAGSAGALAARDDGSFLSVRADGGTLATAGPPRWTLERALGGEAQPDLFADRVNAVTFSPDGKILAAAGGEPSRSGDITLFDVASGKTTGVWKERHSDSVISLDFSPDGKLLASGAADKIARVTDVATGEEVHLFEGHTHYVNGVAFRSDGRVLATAGADGVVNSWDLTNGERKKKIEGWTKEVTSLQFVGATDRIVTSAGDNLIRIVTDTGTQVRAIPKLPDFMQAAASTADGKTIVAGGEDSYLRVWNGTDGKEIAAFGKQ